MNYKVDILKLEEFVTINKDKEGAIETEEEVREVYSLDENGKEILMSKEKFSREFPKGKEVDTIRYDIIMNLLGTIFQTKEEIDTTLGIERALQNEGLGLDLAFTTLVEYGIIKEIEE